MSVLGETGAAVAWVGEHGVRYHAGGRALTRSAALAEAQAAKWANPRTRLAVARAMYALRFPDEDPAGLTRQELLGREGRRVKDCYREHSARTGVPWRGHRYTPGRLHQRGRRQPGHHCSAQCMYGIAHAVVASLACTPALGFVHSGHTLSFVLDIADLYKTEIGIPLAFDVSADDDEDVGARTRRALRDRINQTSLLDRCVDDIKALLLPTTADRSTAADPDEPVVLPAPAGMAPSVLSRASRSDGAPRTRRDGPAGKAVPVSQIACSPHPRGWSLAGVPSEQSDAVLPAPRGWSPGRTRRHPRPLVLPAPAADGPAPCPTGRRPAPCSPHPRGWSRPG